MTNSRCPNANKDGDCMPQETFPGPTKSPPSHRRPGSLVSSEHATILTTSTSWFAHTAQFSNSKITSPSIILFPAFNEHITGRSCSWPGLITRSSHVSRSNLVMGRSGRAGSLSSQGRHDLRWHHSVRSSMWQSCLRRTIAKVLLG